MFPDIEPAITALLQAELLVSALPSVRTFYESVFHRRP